MHTIFYNKVSLAVVLAAALSLVVAAPDDRTEQELFCLAYQNNLWMGAESRSGVGASLDHTGAIRIHLPAILEELCTEIGAPAILLDAACGDLNWFKLMQLPFLAQYIGVDIVPELIELNKASFASGTCTFIHANVITDELPKADIILCRSLFPLLFNVDIMRTINNFKKTGARYLITSHYPQKRTNAELPAEIRTLIWVRPINLELPPFNFPEPLVILYEGEAGPIAFDKSLALWRLADIPEYDIK